MLTTVSCALREPAPGDRPAAWQRALSETFVDLEVTVDQGRPWTGELTAQRLGALAIGEMALQDLDLVGRGEQRAIGDHYAGNSQNEHRHRGKGPTKGQAGGGDRRGVRSLHQ